MDLKEYLSRLNSGEYIKAGSPVHQFMHGVSQEALKLTAKLNSGYQDPQEIREIFSEIIGKPVDETFAVFPPFYTEINEVQEAEETMTDIKVTVNGSVFEAKIYNDSPCAQQLLSKFPLTVTMNELNGNEKYYRFSESFSSNPENVESINSGDIMLYQSDYLVLFYETHNTSYTYTRIGYITDATGLKEAVGPGNPMVTFEIS